LKEAEDDAMNTSTQDRLLPNDMTMWNPRGCLVSVIDEPVEAWRAAEHLREAGFAAEDVRVALAHEVTEVADTSREHSILGIVRGIFSLGDEGIIAASYLDEARSGHHLLIVYAPKDDQRRRAHAVVADHQAHAVHYYGRWVISGQV
jgi:hypothetical protein